VFGCGALVLLGALLLSSSGCGYHVAGRGGALPQEWKTIAVPALKNRTNEYRLEQRLTQALVREMLARTKYRIVPDAKDGDGVIEGEVTSIETNAVLFDPTTNRATTMLVSMTMKVSLMDRASGKAVYQNNRFVFRDEYNISTDIPSFFQEESVTLDRMSRDFASRLVSALLENF
jgi:outer membrane lipopolysaccharide assembly protein LptE/RlpB